MGNSTEKSRNPKPDESACDPDPEYKPELVKVKTIVQPTDVEIVDPSEMKPPLCLPCHLPGASAKPDTHGTNSDEGSSEDSLFVNQVTREAVRGSLKISSGPNAEENNPTVHHSRHQWTTSPVSHPAIRVVSYNILADLYADSDFFRNTLFPQCPPHALCIDYRARLIMDELIGYNGDVILLQEVDRKVFEEDLAPELLRHGFAGVYSEKELQTDEGEACFYRTSRFRQLDSHKIHFSQLLLTSPCQHLWNKVKENGALEEKMADLNTIVQVVVLESLDNPNEILVAGNTHLYFGPTACHIRLLQSAMCLTSLQTIRDDVSASHPDATVAIILGGDFNSPPSCGVVEYVKQGHISADHNDWTECPGEEVTGLEMSHGLSLDSACGTPEFTNYTVGFKGCIDYIFYETDKMDVKCMVPFPEEKELANYVACPNVVFPSDHLACIADLVWK